MFKDTNEMQTFTDQIYSPTFLDFLCAYMRAIVEHKTTSGLSRMDSNSLMPSLRRSVK